MRGLRPRNGANPSSPIRGRRKSREKSTARRTATTIPPIQSALGIPATSSERIMIKVAWRGNRTLRLLRVLKRETPTNPREHQRNGCLQPSSSFPSTSSIIPDCRLSAAYWRKPSVIPFAPAESPKYSQIPVRIPGARTCFRPPLEGMPAGAKLGARCSPQDNEPFPFYRLSYGSLACPCLGLRFHLRNDLYSLSGALFFGVRFCQRAPFLTGR